MSGTAPRVRADVYLTPGQYLATARPVTIKTILGSCVAVCLWDPQRRIGGLNHYLLPSCGINEQPDARYGTVAIPALFDDVLRLGADRTRLRVAVIGGARPLSTPGKLAVGDSNVALALAMLRERGVRVGRQETGGPCGRKVLFSCADGTLIIRFLGSTRMPVAGGRA